MKVTVVNDQNRVVTTDDQNVVIVQGGNSVTVADVGPQGPAGIGAEGYILQAYDTTDQTAANTTTAYPIKLGTVDISDGITVANNGSGDPTQITFANDGDYNIQFSIQFQNSSASEAHVNVWFRKNGVDIADSNSQATVPKKHGSDDGSLILALNLIVNVGSSDYVEMYWSTESTDVSIQTLPAGTSPTTPATPSVIVTATVNRYLEGIASGGTTGQVLTKASATDYDTTWSTPGMTLVKTQTIGSAVASVEVTNVFSATYDNYLITVTPGTASTTQKNMRLQLGSATTNYNTGLLFANYNNSGGGSPGQANAAYFDWMGSFGSTNYMSRIEVMAPYLAKYTFVSAIIDNDLVFGFSGGVQKSTTQFSAFTLTPSSGTVTGGTICVYGYTK